MELDVKNLSYGEVGNKESFDIDLSKIDLGEDAINQEITGKVEISRTDEGLLAEFQIDPKVKLTCDRCQEEFIFEPNLKFKKFYALGRLEEDSDILPVSKNFTIDIETPVREEFLLSIPYKKLCSGICKGICSHCGGNRNQDECDCKSKVESL